MRQRSLLLAVSFAFVFVQGLGAQQFADDQRRLDGLRLYREGQDLMSRERFDLAVEAFTKAIEKDPLLTYAHYQRGQAYMALQRFASAIASYEGCVAAMRTLHDLEGSHRFEVERQRDDEIRELRHEVNASLAIGDAKRAALEGRLHDLENQRSSMGGPFRPPGEVLLALGSAHFRNGDVAEAEAQWKAALAADPKLGQAHNNLAVIYMSAHRWDDAEREIRLAEKSGFRVNPQFKEDLKRARIAR